MKMADLMLDGNAIGGLLQEVFVEEMTTARTTCGSCGAVREVGALHVFTTAPGMVVRCPLNQTSPFPFEAAEASHERNTIGGEKDQEALQIVARSLVSAFVADSDVELVLRQHIDDRKRDYQPGAKHAGDQEQRRGILDHQQRSLTRGDASDAPDAFAASGARRACRAGTGTRCQPASSAACSTSGMIRSGTGFSITIAVDARTMPSKPTTRSITR